MSLQPVIRIPYQDKYDRCKKFAWWAEWILLAAGVLSLLFAFPFFMGIPVWFYLCLTVANILLILGQFILSMVIEIYMYPDAEADRLKGLFDDSLDTQMLEKPVQGYYSNGVLSCGVRKLLVNSFENCFFTYNVARKMTPWFAAKNLVFFTLFVVAVFFGLPTNGWISLVQIFVSQAFLLVLLKHLYFTHCVRSAFEGFKSAFADPSKLEANALHAMLTYEKALSRYSNLLNSKVYEQLKQRLSSEWEVLKQRYSIV